MIAPNGFLNFFEIAEWAREVARDLAWAKRIVPDAGGGRRLDQVPGERDAIECWAMANFIANPFVTICSASGVVMRAPDALNKHLDQIEILPIPLPIEDSSLELPDFNKGFELGTRYYFRDRFAYFDWHTGCVDASRADGDTLIGITGESQFSNATTNYLLQRQSRMNMAITRLSGWSICVKEDSIGETVADMYSAFGVNRALLERLNLVDSGFFSFLGEDHSGNLRKRDKALQAYEDRFPAGHEADGLTLKEATNDVSDAIGLIVSVDTMRRALGKKN